jgi:hypothetical protein
MISFLRLGDHIMHMNDVAISALRRKFVTVSLGNIFTTLHQSTRVLQADIRVKRNRRMGQNAEITRGKGTCEIRNET